MKHGYYIGAFAIILDDQDRVLLCHRNDYDLWNLPGGGMHLNEAPWECVVREVKEEVGLDVEVERLAGVYSKRNQDDLVFSFVCRVVGGKLTLTDEADQIDYFSFGEIPKNTSPKQVERIKDVLDDKSKTLIMRVQEGPSSISLIKKGKL
jgi:ADP-ribose pyrophosphatase YjhB (NUDIX family)